MFSSPHIKTVIRDFDLPVLLDGKYDKRLIEISKETGIGISTLLYLSHLKMPDIVVQKR